MNPPGWLVWSLWKKNALSTGQVVFSCPLPVRLQNRTPEWLLRVWMADGCSMLQHNPARTETGPRVARRRLRRPHLPLCGEVPVALVKSPADGSDRALALSIYRSTKRDGEKEQKSTKDLSSYLSAIPAKTVCLTWLHLQKLPRFVLRFRFRRCLRDRCTVRRTGSGSESMILNRDPRSCSAGRTKRLEKRTELFIMD